MPKVAKELKAIQVARLEAPGLHPVGRVAGLCLQISRTGAKSWILRVSVAGKRHEIGLGSYPGVPLAVAHQRAQEHREAIRQGANPLEERRAKRAELLSSRSKQKTFEQCAEDYISVHAPGWKNKKHEKQWRSTLQTYAYPVMGTLPVQKIEREHVIAALQPIWTTKTETATRLRSRIELVMSYAMQAGYRPMELNPARWRGGLDKLLPAPRSITKVKHFAALPLERMPEFMARLRSAEGMGATALEFTILTAARSGEVRGATWSEIDLAARVWTIPASRMKAKVEHRVPLSRAAMALLGRLPEGKPDELVFPAPRGGQLSDMTLTAVLRRLGETATVHGFRSTFRDWAGERTSYPRDLCEMALAHTISNKVEAAYRRGDMLARRMPMMEDWAAFVRAEHAPAGVAQLAAKVAA